MEHLGELVTLLSRWCIVKGWVRQWPGEIEWPSNKLPCPPGPLPLRRSRFWPRDKTETMNGKEPRRQRRESKRRRFAFVVGRNAEMSLLCVKPLWRGSGNIQPAWESKAETELTDKRCISRDIWKNKESRIRAWLGGYIKRLPLSYDLPQKVAVRTQSFCACGIRPPPLF